MSPGSKRLHFIGTPDYIAPEILNGKKADKPSVDWWSFGVLMFEFIVGIPPFNGESIDEIFDNIRNLRIPWDLISIGKNFKFYFIYLKLGYGENQLTPEAYDLISKLLKLNEEERITKNGSALVREHPFFKGIDWVNLRSIEAPIIPMKSLDKNISLKVFSDKEKNDPFFKNKDSIKTQTNEVIINYFN